MPGSQKRRRKTSATAIIIEATKVKEENPAKKAKTMAPAASIPINDAKVAAAEDTTMSEAKQISGEIISIDDLPPSFVAGEFYTEVNLTICYLKLLNNISPKKILALDLDHSLVNPNTVPISFIHLDRIRRILDLALQQQILVMILTARMANDFQMADNKSSAYGIAKQIGIDYFHAIGFSNGYSKGTSLLKIHNLALGTTIPYSDTALLDDNEVNLNACRKHKFTVFDAKKEGYLEQMQEFVAPSVKPIINKP